MNISPKDLYSFNGGIFLKINEALNSWFLEDYSFPAIGRQRLYQQFLVFFKEKKYKNQNIERISSRSNPYRLFQTCCASLEAHPDVDSYRQHHTKGYSYFVNRVKKPTAKEIISAIYPYGYLSYLSAMKIYGLTQIASSNHHFTTLDRMSWRDKAIKDLPKVDGQSIGRGLGAHDLMRLIPTYPIESEYLGESLVVFSTKQSVEYEVIGDVRVQNVIDLFVDMTRRPQYCGGFENVLSVYNSYVDRYLDAIIARVDDSGTDIDKSRIGFILSKMLMLKHPKLDVWKDAMKQKRGGSRKLISYLAFDSVFDPDWNISLNHVLAKAQGTHVQ